MKNRGLLEEIDGQLVGRDVQFRWVRGHSGNVMNEVADKLATDASGAIRNGKQPVAGPGWSVLPRGYAQPYTEASSTEGSRQRAARPDRAALGRSMSRPAAGGGGRPGAGRGGSASGQRRRLPGGRTEVLYTGLEPDDDGSTLRVPQQGSGRKPILCSSCDKPMNPYTGECLGCSMR